MAASGTEENTTSSDGETYIEKYTRGVSAVESILALDRLRQEVVIKEKLASRGRNLRKTASVPNISVSVLLLVKLFTPLKIQTMYYVNTNIYIKGERFATT